MILKLTMHVPHSALTSFQFPVSMHAGFTVARSRLSVWIARVQHRMQRKRAHEQQ